MDARKRKVTDTRKALEEVIKYFSKGMKTGVFNAELFSENAYFHCSHTGEGTGGSQMARRLLCPEIKADDQKQNVENILIHWKNKRAQISFHYHHIYVLYAENHSFHFMQYGGTFVLSCAKKETGWEIDRLLFDLCWLDGNSFWAEKWNMIDFHIPIRYKKVISAEKDGVWDVIPENEEPETDEEQIKELLFLYGWVIDTEDYELFEKISISKVRIHDGYHDREFQGQDEWISFLKELNAKEPCLHHTYQIQSIISGEKQASAVMSRLEPNRIGSKTINEDTWFLDWLTLDYIVVFCKIKGKWKIQEVKFEKNIRGAWKDGN